MTELSIPISLLVLHFVADFLLQTDKMAVNKSKHLGWLTTHVAVYSAAFTLFFGLTFGAVTFATHWLTDFFTSKASRRLFPWQPNYDDNPRLYLDVEGVEPLRSRHWFFTMIGFDQLIHFATLALTYRWLYGT